MRNRTAVAATALWALAVAACGSHGGGGGGDGTDGGQPFSAITVSPAQQTVTVELDGSASQSYSVTAVVNGTSEDVTAQCNIAVDPAYGTSAADVVTVGPHGGVATVTATCGSITGTAQLTIDVTGSVMTGSNTPANAPMLFGSAAAGSDSTRQPVTQYPIDQAVAPLNIPSVEFQWAASGNDLFHISLQSTHLTVDVYTSDLQSTLSSADWYAVAQSVAGTSLSITIEGLLQASPATKYAGAPTTLQMSFDTIDTSAIYYWASSQGSIMSSTFGSTSAPTPVPPADGNCSGCHSLSKSGNRIGYCRCVGQNCGDEYIGFLRYDTTSNAWTEVVNADQETIHGTYTTFAPLGNPFPDDSKSLALATMFADSLPDDEGSATGGSNAYGTAHFELYDPDTGYRVTTNAAAQSIKDPTGGPNARSALMPDWSADGTQVVYSSVPAGGDAVDLDSGVIATMSYTYNNGANVFGDPKVLVQGPLTLASGTYENLFFPSYSPDDGYVVFNAARAGWRDTNTGAARSPGQRLMIVKADGTGVTELANMNGSGDLDTTWPHWAPGDSSDYYWVVFSSERDYGHEVTVNNTNSSCVENGVTQCKQIWIGAVSKAALEAGMIDPSSPPMWLPGQDTQADNISPFWTKPTSIQ